MQSIVISLGGSIFLTGEDDIQYIRDFSTLILELSKQYKFYLTVGGGTLARDYIALTKNLGGNETYLDEVGILATRMNARVLITALGEHAYPHPAESLEEAMIAGKSFDIVVLGGTHPGQTTDAVSVMLCERVNGQCFINATSVDGVYTSDPKTDPQAKWLARLTPQELLDIVFNMQTQAGQHIVIDPVAAKVILRSNITTYVLHGRDLKALRAAITGTSFHGTIISN